MADPGARDLSTLAYDPTAFRTLGHDVVDRIADYLERVAEGRDLPVGPDREPLQQLECWPGDFPPGGGDDPAEIFARVIARAHHLHDPRSIGHQLAPALPLAALADLVTSFLNNSAAVYEMGPVATAVETRVVRWMCESLGMPGDADGALTSGGSLGNLTALLAMRQARTGYDVRREGQHGVDRPAILASPETHYCVRRAAQVLGFGTDAVVDVPTDARRRVEPSGLPESFDAAERSGRRVLGVVASACSTSTGAIDPLDAIADFCEARGLWLHVDGAHGASLALSPRYRDRIRGIERADSIVWDAHKLLLMPSLITGVLFRDGAIARSVLQESARYLFVGDRDLDLGQRTLECTKPAYGLKLYAALRAYGSRAFGDYVSSVIDRAAEFAAHLDAANDFELALPPDANIVCFRYAPPRRGDLDELQRRIRKTVVEQARAFVSQTVLDGRTWLRCTILHPRTTLDELRGLLDEVRAAGAV